MNDRSSSSHRRFKDALYDQFARVGRAVSAPKRLELLDLLSQGPRTGLRHAFGTHAMRAGANIEAVRERMGHDDLGTTAGYLHAVAADKVAVIDALSGQLAGNVDKSSSLM